MSIINIKLSLVSAIFLAVTVAASCSPAPAPVSTSQRDPSNPNAPEGVTPPVVTNAAPLMPTAGASTTGEHSHSHSDSQHGGHEAAPPAAATAGHEGHSSPAASSDGGGGGGGGGGEVTYVCPMHPEVTSTKAGSTCPKCNMKLVPKK